MITATTSLDEIRRIGLEALLERLGPVGMIRFLQQVETGCCLSAGYGDYTTDRESWLTEIDLDTLVSKIQEQSQTNEKDDIS